MQFDYSLALTHVIFQMFRKLLDKAFLLTARIINDELSQALFEATTEDNWQASTAVLHKIAALSFQDQNWQKIRYFIEKHLKNKSRWKKLIKAMHIVQFLLKNGPNKAISHYKYQVNLIRNLQTYQLTEDEVDRGAAIRERAKAIVQLLQDDQLLQDERIKAKKIRQRMSTLSGTTSYSSDSFSKDAPYQHQKAARHDSYESKEKDSHNRNKDVEKEEEDSSYLEQYFSNPDQLKRTQKNQETTEFYDQQSGDAEEKAKGYSQNKQTEHQSPIKQKTAERQTKTENKQNNANVESMKVDLTTEQQYYNQHHFNSQKIKRIVKVDTLESASQSAFCEIIPEARSQTPVIDILSSLDGLVFTSGQPQSQDQVHKKSSQGNSVSSHTLGTHSNLTKVPEPIPIYNNYPSNNSPYDQQQYAPYPNYPTYNQPNYQQNVYQQNTYGNNPYNPYYQQNYESDSRYATSYNSPSYSNPLNPYLNISPRILSQISSVYATPLKQEESKENLPSKNLNNAPSNMKNIKWMSNTQKQLTDLSDLNVDVKTVDKQSSKTHGRQEINNVIKIDQWTW